ncbi:MAG: MOSC domain-containing protein [Chloroflexota bacterium]
MTGKVIGVHMSDTHTFSKYTQEQINLLAGLGVEGDAHLGVTVKHRSRVKADPTQPNLRQVHLVHSELFDEVAEKGFSVKAGDIGENITTADIDLLSLPRDTVLKIGGSAAVQITGLRNPCAQLDNFQKGLMAATLDKDEDGNLVRKAGIMGIVLNGGPVKIGDEILVELPPEPHHQLERV